MPQKKGRCPMSLYIGLDVHSKKTNYCCQDSQGKIVSEGNINTAKEDFEKMKKKLKLPKGTKIGLESGVQAGLVVSILMELELDPIVIHAFEVRRKARRVRQKTDRRDAFEICDGLRRGIYNCFVYIPEKGIMRIRNLLFRRNHFVKISTMEINGAKHVLRQSGYGSFVKSLTRENAWNNLLGIKEISKEILRDVRRHFSMWLEARKQITEIEMELKESLKPYEKDIKILQTMPGIGLITASTYFATLGTPHRFPDSNHVISYTGLAPSMEDSGNSEKHGSITKCGSKSLRMMLCEAAHHASYKTNPLRPYFVRVLTKKGIKRAVVSIANRMARILYQMWKNQEPFDVSKLNVEYIEIDKKEKMYVIKK